MNHSYRPQPDLKCCGNCDYLESDYQGQMCRQDGYKNYVSKHAICDLGQKDGKLFSEVKDGK